MAKLLSRFGLGAVVVTGVLAGLIFAAFEMLAAAMLMGPEAAAMPLRMIGAMLLGPEALDSGYPLAVAAATGVLIHMTLSIAFAGVFAAIVSSMFTATAGEFLRTAPGLALAGIVFGVALWLVNFYLIAPLAGWTWFPERSDPVVQFLAHAFFFGCPVGWMLARTHVAIGATM